ncbi:MAG: MerR family transcriptional regulator [Actinomycetia bacterium]|nr:MerR family transcriptional regulator [Actinomycetes bacterium]
MSARPVPMPQPFEDDETPRFVISVAAERAGLHAQTLRQYDRLGLVSPSRTRGGGRRYSSRDIALLREVQALSQDGISLPGIARILELQRRVSHLEDRLTEVLNQMQAARPGQTARVFSVSSTGDVYATAPGKRAPGRGRALVLWRPTDS